MEFPQVPASNNKILHHLCTIYPRWKDYNEMDAGDIQDILKCVRMSEIPSELLDLGLSAILNISLQL